MKKAYKYNFIEHSHVPISSSPTVSINDIRNRRFEIITRTRSTLDRKIELLRDRIDKIKRNI